MGLKSLKERFTNRLSSSSASSSATTNVPPQPQAPIAPPSYEDVPVFANPASPEKVPYLPTEILAEIVEWAVIPAFDEYRQQESAIHVTTLRNLANVSTTFLDMVRWVCRESPEFDREDTVIPSVHVSYYSPVSLLETASAWMPLSVMAGIFTLKIFEKERRSGKLVAKLQGYPPNLTALIFLLWNRQAMEKMEGVPRHSLYLPYPAPFSLQTTRRGSEQFNVVLKALAICRHLKFSYVRLSIPNLRCDAKILLEAVKTIAPTRYLEINLMILGWSDEEHPKLPGFGAKLPLEILQAGLTKGASRVDIYNFRLGDHAAVNQSREIYHDGSLVNFIRARNVPDGIVTTVGGTVFVQLNIGGNLDFSKIASSSKVGASYGISDFRDRKSGSSGSRTSSISMGALGKGNRVIISPFMYSLTAVRDGQIEWMGDGEKFAANHFLELAVREGEGLGTAERRGIEAGWRAEDAAVPPVYT